MMEKTDVFMTEANLKGQADPTRFFSAMFAEVFESVETGRGGSTERAALLVLEKGDVQKAMTHCLEKADAKVFRAGPMDSYNYMLDTIINEGVVLLVSDSDGIRQILKNSAELKIDAVLISDRYVPDSLIGSIGEAWGCDVFIHYTRPELAGLGAFGKVSGKDCKLRVCEELEIEIFDPETGYELPPGKWGEIVVTTTFSAAEPMVSYRTGDVSRLLKESMRERKQAAAGGQPAGIQIIDMIKKRTSM